MSGSTAINGYPMWYYGVDTPETLQYYVYGKNRVGKGQISQHNTYEGAKLRANSSNLVDVDIIARPKNHSDF